MVLDRGRRCNGRRRRTLYELTAPAGRPPADRRREYLAPESPRLGETPRMEITTGEVLYLCLVVAVGWWAFSVLKDYFH